MDVIHEYVSDLPAHPENMRERCTYIYLNYSTDALLIRTRLANELHLSEKKSNRPSLTPLVIFGTIDLPRYKY